MMKIILMIHGMFGSYGYWDNFKSYFEDKGYHCLTPVLRHHDINPEGEPHPDLGVTSLLDYAADMEKIIKDLKEPPIIMGHSMGGLIAQMLGAKGFAKKLVLLTPAPPRGVVSYDVSSVKNFLGEILRWGFWKKPHRFRFETADYALFNLLPLADKKKAYAKLVYESGWAVVEIVFWLFDSKKASKVDASKVTCPVLVAGAQKDRSTPLALVRKIADRYGNVSTYKEFENHSHWLINEPGWQDVAAAAHEWIEGSGKSI